MFDDAFTATARDGADVIEIVVRLQKAFISLSSLGHAELKDEAYRHSELALARAELALKLPQDIERARALADKLTARSTKSAMVILCCCKNYRRLGWRWDGKGIDRVN